MSEENKDRSDMADAVALAANGEMLERYIEAGRQFKVAYDGFARELTQGIKNEVEDLRAVFKKMAILRPNADSALSLAQPQSDRLYVPLLENVQTAQTLQSPTLFTLLRRFSPVNFPSDFDPFALEAA